MKKQKLYDTNGKPIQILDSNKIEKRKLKFIAELQKDKY